jgi:hypothetical protein
MHTDLVQIYLMNHLTMSNSSNTTLTPKDMKKRTAIVLGLDPDNPNDAAFKLVTILVFLLCHKKHNFPPLFYQ